MVMKPVTITLKGDTAFYLVFDLKGQIAKSTLQPTTARVYQEVVDAIVASVGPQDPRLHVVAPE
jgi:hypothetical protein